jgi:hypothetical protein
MPDDSTDHYVINKDGSQTWMGPTRSEVTYYRTRLEICRIALEGVVCLSNQGSVVTLAADALARSR